MKNSNLQTLELTEVGLIDEYTHQAVQIISAGAVVLITQSKSLWTVVGPIQNAT